MIEYFEELIERAQYYEQFEFFRKYGEKVRMEINWEWTCIKEKYYKYN